MMLRHDPIVETHTLRWPDEAACADFAQRLAPRLAQQLAPNLASTAPGSAFITLQGPLGAGKTTFVRHLLRALGVAGRIKSPTYAVLEPHRCGELTISHFDFYRFDDPREWADAGLRDVFAAPGLKLAEWPEKAAGALPQADLALHIEPLADGSRTVRAHAHTALGRELLMQAP
jgi:tRNA threonylcarbamoyladenosine biosynthesis protein TsaE